MNPILVLLVEDHQIVRQGLRLLIETQPDLKVVGEVSNGKDAIHSILNIVSSRYEDQSRRNFFYNNIQHCTFFK